MAPLKTSGMNNESGIKTYVYQPGLSYWPEHLWSLSLPLKQDVQVEQGSFYTLDANGYLIVPTAAGGIAQCQRGVWQCTRDWTNSSFPRGQKAASSDTADGQRRDLFYGLTSFVVAKAKANIVPGQLVDVDATTTTVGNDAVKPNTTRVPNAGTLGVCLDILKLSKDSQDSGVNYDDRTRPLKTADDDIVLVRLGVS